MGFFDLVALGAAVGVDTLSVSVGIGVAGISRRRVCQLGSAFTLTTAALFALGCALAIGIRRLLRMLPRQIGLDGLVDLSPDVLHDQANFVLALLAGAILLGLGIHLMAAKGDALGSRREFLTVRGLRGLVWLAVLVSVDAVSAGLSLGMMSASQAAQAVVVVGAVNGSMSFFGLGLGRRLSVLVNGRMRLVGGLILIGLSVRLIANLLFSS